MPWVETTLTKNTVSYEAGIEDFRNHCKAVKKSLKKLKQKVKRNQNKVVSNPLPPDVTNESNRVTNKESSETKVLSHENDTNIRPPSSNDDSDDITSLTEETSSLDGIDGIADVEDIPETRDNNDSVNNKEFNDETCRKFDKMSTEDLAGFTSVTKGKKQPQMTFFKTPEGYGNEALRLITEGNFPLAIDYLSKGISLDRTDHRHHINRSYCYLRTGEYNLALEDIKYVIEHLTDSTELSRAKCREGQALRGLKEYEAAEIAFRESINFAPEFLSPKRELKRTQMLQLLDMGFIERDVILALERNPETGNAVDSLLEETSKKSEITERHEITSDDEEVDEDEIFCSDSEEDPSNERMFSKLLDYKPSLDDPYNLGPPPVVEPVRNNDRAVRAPSQERPLRICKAIPTTPKIKSNQGINEMAIWVGNLKPPMNEAMIKKTFSRFGKVSSIFWCPPNEYCFVNFVNASSSHKALEAASFGNEIEVNGMKVFVKPATIHVPK